MKHDEILNSRSEIIEDKKLDYLKITVDINDTDSKRRKFLTELIEHPERLEEFSEDRLEQILQLYRIENKKIEESLRKKGILN